MFGKAWLRRYLKKRAFMKSLPVDQAELWHKRFALAYGFCAWNALLLLIYQQWGTSKPETSLKSKVYNVFNSTGDPVKITHYKLENFTVTKKESEGKLIDLNTNEVVN